VPGLEVPSQQFQNRLGHDGGCFNVDWSSPGNASCRL
jgi:hypothetical protein